MTALATARDTAKAVGRPYSVLIPLVKKDLALASEAAKEASLPYQVAAGNKLIEAQAAWDKPMPEFWAKASKDTGYSIAHLRNCVNFASATNSRNFDRAQHGAPYRSLNDFRVRAQGMKEKIRPPSWHDPIKKTLGKVDPSRYEEEANRKADEKLLRTRLALELIDIGFKALATKLHPDKGGSTAAMTRLNAVAAKLRHCAKS